MDYFDQGPEAQANKYAFKVRAARTAAGNLLIFCLQSAGWPRMDSIARDCCRMRLCEDEHASNGGPVWLAAILATNDRRKARTWTFPVHVIVMHHVCTHVRRQANETEASLYACVPQCHRRQENGKDVAYPVHSIVFHPGYGTFATGGGDGVINFWDGDNKKRLFQIAR